MGIALVRLRDGDDTIELTAEDLAIFMLFLESLIKETYNPEVLQLATIATVARAQKMGIDSQGAQDLLSRIVQYCRSQQAAHPFAGLF